MLIVISAIYPGSAISEKRAVVSQTTGVPKVEVNCEAGLNRCFCKTGGCSVQNLCNHWIDQSNTGQPGFFAAGT